MPSVKIPRHSTDFDMTPFVDVAFLILSFFMLATKFKPPSPVEITTPYSVSSKELEQKNAIMIEMDKLGRVFFTMQVEKQEDNELKRGMLNSLNKSRNLGLGPTEIDNFVRNSTIGLPFSKLKGYLALTTEQQNGYESKMEGIPVLDSTDNQLVYWVAEAKKAFGGTEANIMVKGDNNTKYPVFKQIIEALRKNELFKYKLITSPEGTPVGSELYRTRNK
ncbi:MAG TPA: biopolymer transporter ExbD [Chitinophagaceae bacterium]|nr:biopolymer transporter ExbD [Chitinophagaceae bacterium]